MSGHCLGVVCQTLPVHALHQRFNRYPRLQVHEYSTRRASGMLAAAVNAQKDIIFDGAPCTCRDQAVRFAERWIGLAAMQTLLCWYPVAV